MRRKSKLNNVLWQFENTYWREKDRVSWLKDGDKCSKFFHTYAKFKRAKAFIHALSIDDVLVDDKQTIADHVVQYYQELYSSTSSCIPSAEMSNIIPSSSLVTIIISSLLFLRMRRLRVVSFPWIPEVRLD